MLYICDMKHNVKCSNCNKQLYRRPSLLKTNKNFFCDYKCSSEHRKTSVKNKCLSCNEIYEVQLYRKESSKYCSEKCSKIGLRKQVSKKCAYCNNDFTNVPSRIGKYCSHSCHMKNIHSNNELHKHYMRNSELPVMYGEQNPAWKGGVTMFKTKGNYKNVRYVRCPQEFLSMSRKDGYVMEHRLVIAKWVGRCLDRKEVVHHIDHNPSNNKKENLLLFPCNSSHKKYEGIENGKSKNNLQGIRNRIR